MGDRVDYNDEAFRRAAAETGGVRDKIDGVISTLTSSIGGRGEPWGGDQLGQSFANGQDGNGYLTSKTDLIGSADNVSGTMGNFHDGQIESADLLQGMEDGNRDGLR